jgi:amino acid adenylation domain-containing protein
MLLFKSLEDAITRHLEKEAFYIKNRFHTYHDLAKKISCIRECIITLDEPEKNIGVVENDDIETYAAIIAIWFEGKSFVALSPNMPKERNEEIIKQSGIKIIIDSSEISFYKECFIINSKKHSSASICLSPTNVPDEDNAYIIFTSGSTGIPKGVPITRNNLSAFVSSFYKLGLNIDENDKWLQMFDLTFDLSIFSYLIPLLHGACVYTIPKEKIKFSYVFELLEEHKLTVALMIPSIIVYLRPYFDEINCAHLKYNLFCGEALPLDILSEWSHCIPNAKIMNVYGPSEATIFCTHYSFHQGLENKSYNGIVSIGKAMLGTEAIVINEDNNLAEQNEIGELCLSGMQLTHGYLNDDNKNNESFFIGTYYEAKQRFYKTGDHCYIDAEGDIMFIGRMDSQIKVQGYRIELSEVEFHVKAHLKKMNAAAIAFKNASNNQEIGVIIESEEFDTTSLINYLNSKIPPYMMPSIVKFEKIFPYNNNGKIDKKELLKRFHQP